MIGNAVSALALRLTRPQRWQLWREAVARDSWTAADLHAFQTNRLRALLEHLAAHVPFYRPLLTGLDLTTTDCREVLASLPLVDKTTIREGGADFRCDPSVAGQSVTQTTGGSSGIVFEFQVGLADREFRSAVDMRTRTWAGWQLGGRQAQIWGHAADVARAGNLGGKIRNALLHRTLTINCLDMQVDDLENHLRSLAEYRPQILVGYASALGFLAEGAGDGWAMTGLRGIISSAETLLPEVRQQIEKAFGVPVLDRYGSREMGVVAQQCEQIGGLHQTSDRLVIEILDSDGRPCRDGERGELVLTDLDNRVMPLVRYRTGDLAIATDERCPCGRPYPLLRTVSGRVSDLLVGVNGRVVSCPGPTFFLAGNPGVRQLQIVQDHPERILLRLVPTSEWGEDHQAHLIGRLHDLLGAISVEVELVEEIPPSPSGKFRFSISSVSPFQSKPPSS